LGSGHCIESEPCDGRRVVLKKKALTKVQELVRIM
jgi:hypothetical protein